MTVRVRFLSNWRGYAVGKRTDQIGRGVAELLAKRGIVRIETRKRRSAPRPNPASQKPFKPPADVW